MVTSTSHTLQTNSRYITWIPWLRNTARLLAQNGYLTCHTLRSENVIIVHSNVKLQPPWSTHIWCLRLNTFQITWFQNRPVLCQAPFVIQRQSLSTRRYPRCQYASKWTHRIQPWSVVQASHLASKDKMMDWWFGYYPILYSIEIKSKLYRVFTEIVLFKIR